MFEGERQERRSDSRLSAGSGYKGGSSGDQMSPSQESSSHDDTASRPKVVPKASLGPLTPGLCSHLGPNVSAGPLLPGLVVRAPPPKPESTRSRRSRQSEQSQAVLISEGSVHHHAGRSTPSKLHRARRVCKDGAASISCHLHQTESSSNPWMSCIKRQHMQPKKHTEASRHAGTMAELHQLHCLSSPRVHCERVPTDSLFDDEVLLH